MKLYEKEALIILFSFYDIGQSSSPAYGAFINENRMNLKFHKNNHIVWVRKAVCVAEHKSAQMNAQKMDENRIACFQHIAGRNTAFTRFLRKYFALNLQ